MEKTLIKNASLAPNSILPSMPQVAAPYLQSVFNQPMAPPTFNSMMSPQQQVTSPTSLSPRQQLLPQSMTSQEQQIVRSTSFGSPENNYGSDCVSFPRFDTSEDKFDQIKGK